MANPSAQISPEMALTILSTYEDDDLAEAMRISPNLLDRLHRIASEQMEALENGTAPPIRLDNDEFPALPSLQSNTTPSVEVAQPATTTNVGSTASASDGLTASPMPSSTAPTASGVVPTQSMAPQSLPVPWQLPGQILMQVPGFGIMTQPGDNSTAPQSAPPQTPAAAKAPPAATAQPVNMLQVPVRGRDVPHSTSASSRVRSIPPQTGGAWHVDRAGHEWRDPPSTAQSSSSWASHSNQTSWNWQDWDWHSNWDDGWHGSNWGHHSQHSNQSSEWHHNQTDTAPETTHAPPQGLHGNATVPFT